MGAHRLERGRRYDATKAGQARYARYRHSAKRRAATARYRAKKREELRAKGREYQRQLSDDPAHRHQQDLARRERSIRAKHGDNPPDYSRWFPSVHLSKED